MKFEYAVHTCPTISQSDLNEWGSDGWELVQIIDYQEYDSPMVAVYFKRAMAEETVLKPIVAKSVEDALDMIFSSRDINERMDLIEHLRFKFCLDCGSAVLPCHCQNNE